MEMHISKVINDDGTIEVYFVKVNHWNDFDLILGLLQQENGCKILSNQEMIYIRKAEVLWHDISFELLHDDMLGNYILVKNTNDCEKLENLAQVVIQSIKEKLERVDSKT